MLETFGSIITSSLSQGILWSIMGVGAYLTFRLLNIPDMSAEGVFPLGAAIAAMVMQQEGGVEAWGAYLPWIGTLAGFVGGAIAGMAAGLITTKLRIPPIITGILLQTGLYSVSLRVMDGSPNIALLGMDTIFTPVQEMLGVNKHWAAIIVGLVIVILIIVLLNYFLNTEIGLAFRSTGDNEEMAEANGINTQLMKIIGYMIGNGIIGMAGAMLAQNNGFADIQMGIGTIVIGLASIVIAEVIIPNRRLGTRLVTIILGSFVYRLIIDLILNQKFIEVRASDLRLAQALILMIVLFYPEIRSQTLRRRSIAKEA